MKLLTDLLLKSMKHKLAFETSPTNGLVRIWDMGSNAIIVTDCYLNDFADEETELELLRMHQEVDAYLNRISVPFMDEHETEHAQAILTEQERKMKEAGHKYSDFL